MSPNMTPKRKGKVIVVKTAGLNSLYQGIPYVFTIYWNAPMNSFVGIFVGGVE